MMKKRICLLVFIVVSVCSCEDIKVTPNSLITLTVVNTVLDNPSIKMTPFNDFFSYGSSLNYTLRSSQNSLYLYSKDDSSRPILNQKLPSSNGNIFLLFVAGSTLLIDTLLINDKNIPVFKDSSMAIRFVNLTAAKIPININLLGNNNGSEVGSLPYKMVSQFKTYRVRPVSNERNRIFEIRNSVSGDLLATYMISGNSIPTFHSITIAVSGPLNVGSEVNTIRVNNY